MSTAPLSARAVPVAAVAVAVVIAAMTLASPARNGGRRIGDQVALDAAWQVDRHLQVSGSYVHFNAGSAVRAAGGRDVDFAMISVSYRF